MNGQGEECWTLYYALIMYYVTLLSRESELNTLSWWAHENFEWQSSLSQSLWSLVLTGARTAKLNFLNGPSSRIAVFSKFGFPYFENLEQLNQIVDLDPRCKFMNFWPRRGNEIEIVSTDFVLSRSLRLPLRDRVSPTTLWLTEHGRRISLQEASKGWTQGLHHKDDQQGGITAVQARSPKPSNLETTGDEFERETWSY